MNRKKEMKQKLVSNNELIESLKLYIILLKQRDNLLRQDNIEKIKEQYELYDHFKTLNSKYSELMGKSKEHILKVDSSDIIYSNKYNFLGLF